MLDAASPAAGRRARARPASRPSRPRWHGVGAAGGEGDLVGADAEALGDHGPGVVEQQPGVAGRPVQAPRVGVPALEGLQQHLARSGVQRLARRVIEVRRNRGVRNAARGTRNAFAHTPKPTGDLPGDRGVASSRVSLDRRRPGCSEVDVVCRRKGSSVGLELPKRFRRVAFGGLMVTALLVLSGCSQRAEGPDQALAMPVAVDQGSATHIYDLWLWSWLAAIVTGVIVWGLIFYAAIRFRRRSETEIPVQTRYNLPIEIFYTIAPVIMVIVFFSFTVDTQNKVAARRRRTPTRPSRSSASSGRGRSTTASATTRPTRQRTSRSAATSSTRAAPPPTGPRCGWSRTRACTFNLRLARRHPLLLGPRRSCSRWTSSPAATTTSRSRPTRSGTFEGRCAELCGVYHSRMLFNVKVVDQAAYDAHLQAARRRRATPVRPWAASQTTSERPGLDVRRSNGGEQ